VILFTSSIVLQSRYQKAEAFLNFFLCFEEPFLQCVGSDLIEFGNNYPLLISGKLNSYFDCDKFDDAKGRGINDNTLVGLTADVYVVRTGSVHLGGPLSDVNGKPNVVLVDSPLDNQFERVNIGRTAQLGEGPYDVIIDECQDGFLGEEDQVHSYAFRIHSDGPLPPDTFSKVQKTAAKLAVPIILSLGIYLAYVYDIAAGVAAVAKRFSTVAEALLEKYIKNAALQKVIEVAKNLLTAAGFVGVTKSFTSEHADRKSVV